MLLTCNPLKIFPATTFQPIVQQFVTAGSSGYIDRYHEHAAVRSTVLRVVAEISNGGWRSIQQQRRSFKRGRMIALMQTARTAL